MLVEWLKKAPTAVTVAVIIVFGLIAMAVLAAFVVLQIAGQDTTDFRQWIQTVGIALVAPLIGVNTVTGLVAARSASRAEDQSNGQLEARDARIAALERQVQALGGRVDG
jgi:ACR3 family arsenite efflux pump ArsB